MNKGSSFFPIFMSFNSSSCLIVIAGNFNLVLKRSCMSEYPILFLTLEDSIQFFTIKYDVSCRFFLDAFHQIGEVPFYFWFAEGIMNVC